MVETSQQDDQEIQKISATETKRKNKKSWGFICLHPEMAAACWPPNGLHQTEHK